MTSPAQAALLRLIANATDQQTCDDLAIVVHAFEQAKGVLRDAEMWLGKAIAENAHTKTVQPQHAIHTLERVTALRAALES